MKLQFLGAAGTVTGSKYLLTTAKEKFLVDCGLFQGVSSLRKLNWQELPIKANEIDAVLLTHAHIDHSGYIPLLVKQGFKGKIYCSAATYDLCTILLPDSGHLQEEEAMQANRYGSSKHQPALPLYTREEAEQALAFFEVVPMHKVIHFSSGFNFSLRYAGHILGASMIYIEYLSSRLLFTGDMGRFHDPIMKAPEAPPIIDYLITESTYGDRLHEKTSPNILLEQLIKKVQIQKSILLIPAFAVGRVQTLLYYINSLLKQKRIAPIPIYLDSPMAINATKLFCKYRSEHQLPDEETMSICSVAQYVQQFSDSMSLMEHQGPMIIISASGMATGGRVLNHLCHVLPDKRNIVLFAGYQARETRGEKLVNGAQHIKIFGENIPVQAEIQQINSISAHADYEEILAWLKLMKEAPKRVFIVHGETDAAEALAKKIETTFMWQCTVPNYLDEFSVD